MDRAEKLENCHKGWMAHREVFRCASLNGWMAHREVLKRASIYNFESTETRFSQHSKETLHAQVMTSRLKRASYELCLTSRCKDKVKVYVHTVDYYSVTEEKMRSCHML